MKDIINALIAVVLIAQPSYADPASTNAVSATSEQAAKTEDWTVNGRTFHNVTVGQVEADRVHITYNGGIGTVMLSDLTPELQKRFKYDPATAKVATEQRNVQIAASDAMVAQAQAQQKEQKEQAEELAQAKASAIQLHGKVLQVMDNGVLLDGYQWGTKEGVSSLGTIFLRGNPGGVTDEQAVIVTAYPSGTYSYVTVMGAKATIPCFTVVLKEN